MTPDDVVVLEISSFQSQRLSWGNFRPHLGMVLNLTPNHLDRHYDMAEYAAAKKALLLHQRPTDFAVLNAADPILRTWTDAGDGQKLLVGASDAMPSGARFDQSSVRLWHDGAEAEVALEGLSLPGSHNRFNAACAAAAAWLLGAGVDSIENGLRRFEGLPDRIEYVGRKGRVRFYNDSIATNPEATMAALESFSGPIVLIAGGSSKRLSFEDVGRRIAHSVRATVLIGATADQIEAAIRAGAPAVPRIERAGGLNEAVERAYRAAEPGDVVLLSPACASYDMFRNYAERGRRFREIVRGL